MTDPNALALLSASLGVHDLALFAATVLVLNATPGVDLLLTVGTTLRQGVRAGLAVAAGICAGCAVHTLGAAFGLAALLATSATTFSLLKWAGAAYLLWLALGLLREGARTWRGGPAAGGDTAAGQGSAAAGPGAAAPVEAAGASAPTLAALFRRGLLTNALNPKVAMFFLALLPQFIDAAAPHKTLAFLVLGAGFIVQSAAFLAAVVLAVAPLRRWQPGPAVRAGLQIASGGLFALLAARLALAERH